MSGIVPARIAANFTIGEVAALSVIARAVREAGVCVLPLDKIAALAGVSRTTAQNAVRAAERLGLILRIERRRRGDRSDTNILRIVSREWLTWLKHGGAGLKKLSTTNNHYYSKQRLGTAPVSNWRLAATHVRTKYEQSAGESGSNLDEVSCSSKSKAHLSASVI